MQKITEIISSLQLQRYTLHNFIPLHSGLLFERHRTEGKSSEQEVRHRNKMLAAERELVATQLSLAQKY
jgi:aryl-alcohol dehydrogenase-like predicted oxidoreductase